MRIKIFLLPLILLISLLASCAPYKMDIRQGNFVTPAMREKLKIGMNKIQVKYVMGTPMVSDPFHANRWDYVYFLKHDGELVEQHRLTLYFEDDKLARMIDGIPPADTASPKTVEQVKG